MDDPFFCIQFMNSIAPYKKIKQYSFNNLKNQPNDQFDRKVRPIT